jgi:hypothetical protein
MPPPAGKQLERLVAAIQHAESTGALVTWNDTIEGRQFDVTVRFRFGLHSYLTVIECKEYSSKVPVEKVDALATKSRDVKANKAILVSTHGFQSGCFPVAERHGIQLLVLTEASETTTSELISRITPGLNVFDVSFATPNSGPPVEFEDWGGRLAYLMNHSKIHVAEGLKTPNQLVFEWQLTQPAIQVKGETSIELQLAGELQQPYEAPVAITAMRFKCALVDVMISKGPLPDNHLRAGLASKVELHDEKGALLHSMRMGDIPLGFDTPVVPAQFYELPHLYNRYYCEKIEGELVTWTLVESYQHGHLFQATIRQNLKYSEYYVPVTDDKIKARLEAMLARLKRHK